MKFKAIPDQNDPTLAKDELTRSPSMVAGDEPVYHMTVPAVIKGLGVDLEKGYTASQVVASREKYGDNVIETVKPKNLFVMLLGHLFNSVSMILVAVFIINCVNHEWIDAGVILFVYLSNAAMGFVQEVKSERSLLSLQRLAVVIATVVRDSTTMEISIDEVVVGDVVLLKVGDEVPADLRLVSATNLEIDEALLTGESNPVLKQIDPLPYPEQVVEGIVVKVGVGDRTNMAFRQTAVVQGTGVGIVVATGYQTQVGDLSKKLMTRGSSRTPLQIKMERFMFILFGIALFLALIVFWVDKWRFRKEAVVYAAATGIAIVPEGLVAVVTIALALAVNRLATRKVIVKKLGVVETLASITNICSDKTGTLTEGKMVVKRFWTPTAPYIYHVSGGAMDAIAGFSIEVDAKNVANPATKEAQRRRSRAESIERASGNVGSHPNLRHAETHAAAESYINSETIQGTPETELSFIQHNAGDLALVCAMCNNTQLQMDPDNEDKLLGAGNPTELALQVFAHKVGRSPSYWASEGWVKCGQWAFDSSAKCMSVGIVRDVEFPVEVDGELVKREALVLVKGAPEVMLPKCDISLTKGIPGAPDVLDVAEIMRTVHSLASQGFRVLACAIGSNVDIDDEDGRRLHDRERQSVENGLRFVGLAVVFDPPRVDSLRAVEQCTTAGITFRMVTGDHHATAENIARRLRILSPSDGHDRVITGPVFDAMSEEQIDSMGDLPLVIARCSPDSKVKMVQALHRRKERVAMTGDGINDAPAIKIADVGAAMGIAGVDITKNVADIVLADDSITSLVAAIEEGRTVATSIKKFIVHLLTGNMAEVIVLMIGLAIADEQDEVVFPLSALQILWINMVTSTPPAIGLTMDPVDPETMIRPPESPVMFTREVMTDQVIYGTLSGILSLCSYLVVIYGFGDGAIGYHCNVGKEGAIFCPLVWRARTTAFVVLNQQLLVLAYVCRAPRGSLFNMIYTNNAMLAFSFIFGTLVLFPIIYIPWIAENMFKSAPISWEWAIVAVCMTFTVVFSEVYKYIKRSLLGDGRLHIVEEGSLEDQQGIELISNH